MIVIVSVGGAVFFLGPQDFSFLFGGGWGYILGSAQAGTGLSSKCFSDRAIVITS